MRFLQIISKLIVGLVFTFSGFVKCIDPLGTAYKITDYLDAWGMGSFSDLSLTLSIIMCGVELLIGLMLIFNTKVKIAAWVALIFMVFYTPLTLYLAIANPVSDCGCFGDALILTNWQTFFKNLVLIGFTLVLFIYRKTYTDLFNPILGWILLLVFAILVFGFEILSLNRLPIKDFRPYKIGVNIQESMEVPEGAAQEIVESIFIYEKDGQSREFTLDNLPDETWTFVDRKDNRITKGYEPPIHDFSISTLDGYDITDQILNSEWVGLIVKYDLNKTNNVNQEELNSLAAYMMARGIKVICLTSTVNEEKLNNYITNNGVPYEFCIADPITLKTIIRSNPGFLLIKNGTILNKWHHRHLPSIKELDNEIQVVEY